MAKIIGYYKENFQNEDVDYDYLESNTENNPTFFEIEPSDTKITLSSDNMTSFGIVAKYQNPIVLSAIVVDDYNNPVKYGYVQFYDNNIPIGDPVPLTPSNDIIEWQAQIKYTPKKNGQIIARYIANNMYNSSQTSPVNITLQNRDTKTGITINGLEPNTDYLIDYCTGKLETFTICAHVFDSDEGELSPLPYGSVTFWSYREDKNGNVSQEEIIGKDIPVNDDGIACMQYAPRQLYDINDYDITYGMERIRAVFNFNNKFKYYNRSTAKAIIPMVKDTNPVFLMDKTEAFADENIKLEYVLPIASYANSEDKEEGKMINFQEAITHKAIDTGVIYLHIDGVKVDEQEFNNEEIHGTFTFQVLEYWDQIMESKNISNTRNNLCTTHTIQISYAGTNYCRATDNNNYGYYDFDEGNAAPQNVNIKFRELTINPKYNKSVITAGTYQGNNWGVKLEGRLQVSASIYDAIKYIGNDPTYKTRLVNYISNNSFNQLLNKSLQFIVTNQYNGIQELLDGRLVKDGNTYYATAEYEGLPGNYQYSVKVRDLGNYISQDSQSYYNHLVLNPLTYITDFKIYSNIKISLTSQPNLIFNGLSNCPNSHKIISTITIEPVAGNINTIDKDNLIYLHLEKDNDEKIVTLDVNNFTENNGKLTYTHTFLESPALHYTYKNKKISALEPGEYHLWLDLPENGFGNGAELPDSIKVDIDKKSFVSYTSATSYNVPYDPEGSLIWLSLKKGCNYVDQYILTDLDEIEIISNNQVVYTYPRDKNITVENNENDVFLYFKNQLSPDTYNLSYKIKNNPFYDTTNIPTNGVYNFNVTKRGTHLSIYRNNDNVYFEIYLNGVSQGERQYTQRLFNFTTYDGKDSSIVLKFTLTSDEGSRDYEETITNGIYVLRLNLENKKNVKITNINYDIVHNPSYYNKESVSEYWLGDF